MGDRYVVVSTFNVFVAQGEGKPERKVTFTRGLVLDENDIPAGHSAHDWVAAGLVKAA